MDSGNPVRKTARKTAILHLADGDRAVARGRVRGAVGPLRGVLAVTLEGDGSIVAIRMEAEVGDLTEIVRAIEEAGLRVTDVAVRDDSPDLRPRPSQCSSLRRETPGGLPRNAVTDG